MSSSTQHAGNADAQWRAVVTQPDMCRVGKDVVGFNSFALLNNKVKHSPNVFGDGLPIYRVGDLFKNVQADAGSHIISGTSGSSGHVLILSGHPSIKLNGKPMAWQSSKCLVNCNAAGVGGAEGQVLTTTKPTPRPMHKRMADESGRVLKETLESIQDSANTIWEALPWTSDEATTAAARGRIAQGFINTIEGIHTLTGPSGEEIFAASLSGNPEFMASVNERIAAQNQAVVAISESVGESWREASARSGTAGAVAMLATTLATETIGGKGTGAVLRASERIASITKAAKTPTEAARMLDTEVRAAKAAGKSPEEINQLEQARRQKLDEARQKRKDNVSENNGSDDGKGQGAHLHVTSPLCFHPYDKDKYKALSPKEKKAYLKEMSDQLGRQQAAIKKMTAAEFKIARDAFKEYGRNPLAKGAQKKLRDQTEKKIIASISRGLQNSIDPVEAKKRAKELMINLAALHEPDMGIGGYMQPNPIKMGRADVNSAIGASWNQEGRIQALDNAANQAIKNGQGNSNMNIIIEICRGNGIRS